MGFKKEWLLNYQEREDENFRKFLDDLRKGVNSDAQYPPSSRFGKISQPLATINMAALSSIYSVVPFYGKTVITIYPMPRIVFNEMNGFPPEDIGKLVDFAKSEGKVALALGGRATKYEKLDFLDPIFELNPPRLSVLPEDFFVDEISLRKARIEFYTIGDLGFKDFCQKRYIKLSAAGLTDDGDINDEYKNDARCYAFAKSLGYTDLTDLIEKMLLEDYESASRLLDIAQHFVFRETLTPLKRIPTYSGYFLHTLRSGITSDAEAQRNFRPVTNLPFEIGRFLIDKKKLTNACDDFEVCKELCDCYRQGDLHKLLIDIQNGIADRDIDAIGSTKEELNITLDNLWKDSDSIRRRQKKLAKAIPASLAIIGELANQAVKSGEGYGFLAGLLGYAVIDSVISSQGEGVSERLAKLRQKDYLVGIFDFNKKIPAALKN
jgi:hypothetical protein